MPKMSGVNSTRLQTLSDEQLNHYLYEMNMTIEQVASIVAKDGYTYEDVCQQVEDFEIRKVQSELAVHLAIQSAMPGSLFV